MSCKIILKKNGKMEKRFKTDKLPKLEQVINRGVMCPLSQTVMLIVFRK